MSTIGTWFEKKGNISIWLPIVKPLSLQSVLKSIPICPICNSVFKGCEANVAMSKKMMYGLKIYCTKITSNKNICWRYYKYLPINLF